LASPAGNGAIVTPPVSGAHQQATARHRLLDRRRHSHRLGMDFLDVFEQQLVLWVQADFSPDCLCVRCMDRTGVQIVTPRA
jgi:hypothetical protein